MYKLRDSENFIQDATETLLDRGNQEVVYNLLQKGTMTESQQLDLKKYLYSYCLKYELLDQALVLVSEFKGKDKLVNYQWMVDMFARPFYVELKYKLAQ